MRTRPSSRLLIVDDHGRLLLFRFRHSRGALAGQDFWATPGGGVEPGESFVDAARRELLEETGLSIEDPGPQVARRELVLRLPDGEEVISDERFFLLRIAGGTLSRDGWTELEQEVMTEHRWWTPDELRRPDRQVWPENIADLLAAALEGSDG